MVNQFALNGISSADHLRLGSGVDARRLQSGRGQPQSKTCRITDGLWLSRERPGVRLSSAAIRNRF